jgi:hypothetical protein
METTFRILLGTAVQHTLQSLKLGKPIRSSDGPSRSSGTFDRRPNGLTWLI